MERYVIVRQNTYVDSLAALFMMSVLLDHQGIETAFVGMATDANKASMETMCEKLQRRRRGVQRQLRDMGLPLPPARKVATRAGTLWTEEDDEQLRKLYHLRCPVEEMARELERSVRAVYLRMERLELYGDEAGYPDAPGR